MKERSDNDDFEWIGLMRSDDVEVSKQIDAEVKVL